MTAILVRFPDESVKFDDVEKRTICVDIRSRRTIFRYAGRTSKRNNSSWWERLLAELRICKLKAIEI